MGHSSRSKTQRSKARSKDDVKQDALSEDQLTDSLSSHLLSSKLCDTSEEAVPTAEAIVDECYNNDSDRSDAIGPMATLLMEYFDQLTEYKANDIAGAVLGVVTDKDLHDDSDDSFTNNGERLAHGSDTSIDDNNSNDDDGEYIGEGECELCEREIKLTRHHLIPKSTWSKMKKRIHNACAALASNQEEKARMILGGNLIDELSQDMIDGDSVSVRRFLSKTCNICRPCHSKVHQLHDEMELAESYSTIDKLLEDEELLKFCKWASKQRAGRYSLSRPMNYTGSN